jgi:hypothetical protein
VVAIINRSFLVTVVAIINRSFLVTVVAIINAVAAFSTFSTTRAPSTQNKTNLGTFSDIRLATAALRRRIGPLRSRDLFLAGRGCAPPGITPLPSSVYSLPSP